MLVGLEFLILPGYSGVWEWCRMPSSSPFLSVRLSAGMWMYVWLGVSKCWRSSLWWLWCAYHQQSLDFGLRSSLIGGSPLISITSKLVFFSYLLSLFPHPLCRPFSPLHMVLAVSFPLFSSIFSPSTIFSSPHSISHPIQLLFFANIPTEWSCLHQICWTDFFQWANTP